MMQWQTSDNYNIYYLLFKQHLLFAFEVSVYNLLCGLNVCVCESIRM